MDSLEVLLYEELPLDISEEVAHVPHEEVIPSEAPVLVVGDQIVLQLLHQCCQNIPSAHPVVLQYSM